MSTPTPAFDGRISTLPLLSTLTGQEEIPVVKNNQNLKVLSSSISAATSGTSQTNSSIGLLGPSQIFAQSVNTYTITTYDMSKTYTATVSSGSVVVQGDTLTVTAPTQTGPVTLTVNQKNYTLQVVANQVLTPSVIYPTENQVLKSQSVTFTSSAFQGTIPSMTQQTASWQMATDAGFTTLFSSLMGSAIQLNSWTVNGLALGATYYVRVQYQAADGTLSAWSPALSFSISTVLSVSESFQALTEPANISDAYYGIAVAFDQSGQNLLVTDDDGDYPGLSSYGKGFLYSLDGQTYSNPISIYPSATYADVSCYFGISADITQDASFIAITDTGSGDPSNPGYVGIYSLNNATVSWVQDFTSTDTQIHSPLTYGIKAAFSPDKNYLFVSSIEGYLTPTNTVYPEGCGAVYVYQYNAGSSNYMYVTMLFPDYANGTNIDTAQVNTYSYSTFGKNFAISSDSQTLFVFGFLYGEIYIYKLNGGAWTFDSRLVPDSTVMTQAGLSQGLTNYTVSVAISQDGTYLAVGGRGSSQSKVTTVIYTQVNNVWTNTQILNNASYSIGNSLVFNSDSSILYASDSGNGNIYVYVKTGNNYILNETLAYPGTYDAGSSSFGSSMALNNQKNILAVGAPDDNNNVGFVYLFS